MRCDKEVIALCAFFKKWGRIVVGKDIFVWDSAQKFCKNYRAARYFSFCAFCLKAAEGIGASQNIFVHPAFLAYVFYDFLRLPLKRISRIYSVRRQACKKNKYAKRKAGECISAIGVAQSAQNIFTICQGAPWNQPIGFSSTNICRSG